MLSRQCILCNADFIVNKPSDDKKFCSRSCSAKSNNRKRLPRSAESRAKTSNTLSSKYSIHKKQKYRPPTIQKTCPECQTEFVGTAGRKYCNSGCRNQSFSKRMSEWLKTNRSHLSCRARPSYMEASFASWLESHGLKMGRHGYLTEVRFYNPTTKRNGWADFVFPKQYLIVELDGSHHRKRTEIDAIRDEYLAKRGWTVLRITYREYQLGVHKDTIKRLLNLETPGGIEPLVFLPSVL